MTSTYNFGKTVSYSFDDAIEKVTEELAKEGFGILATIDVAATMKKKLDLDMPAYQILGACNPQLAHRGLEIDPALGVLLPCNIVVRQDEANQVHVDFMEPEIVLELVTNPEMEAIAIDAKARLARVVEAL